MDEISKLKDEIRQLKILNDIYTVENERLKYEYRILYDKKDKKSILYKIGKKVYNFLRRIKKKFYHKEG